MNYESWGRYPKATPTDIYPVHWQHEDIPFSHWDQSVLPYGQGRSYGDVCLNDGGILLQTSPLQRFLSFNEETGVLRCEAGTTFKDISDLIVPRGWFIPVTPGTQFVSLGGAVANDVHGKNHHRQGTFGCHVLQFCLLRSSGDRLLCSPTTHPELFRATIGGMGLTGLLVWVEIQLQRIQNPWMIVERKRFTSLEQFFDYSLQADQTHEYTVAWIDGLHRKPGIVRGSFICGNHLSPSQPIPCNPKITNQAIYIPCDLPSFMLNPLFLRMFNSLYFHLTPKKPTTTFESYEKFFYPLDAIHHWNRLYGKKGFFQYQCVIPPPFEHEGITSIFKHIQQANQGSFLGVLKRFGTITSPGLLSFPRSGTTLALDFPFRGDTTFRLFSTLDSIVRDYQGALYPAKDARMPAADFQQYFPKWQEFSQYIDPQFSSSFWRRVTGLVDPSHQDQNLENIQEPIPQVTDTFTSQHS